jgi:hypothetical protein
MNVFIYVDTSKKVGDPARVPQKKRMRSFSSIERHLPLCRSRVITSLRLHCLAF